MIHRPAPWYAGEYLGCLFCRGTMGMGERAKAPICSVFQFQWSEHCNGKFQATNVTLLKAKLGRHV